MASSEALAALPGIPETLAGLVVPIDRLRPYSKNARRGNVELIAESLQRNGQYRPVVANRRTGEVLAGNHTLAAARSLEWPGLAVTWVDVDEAEAARIVLADNRLSDLGTYDDQVLADLLSDLDDLTGTGYSADDLDSLLASVTELPTIADPDAAPDAPAVPRTRLGDVWLLGPHRVVCGDSTDAAAYDALLGEERVDAVWTDPPYGVSYVGKTKDALTIQGDAEGELEALLRTAFGLAFEFCREGGAWYVACADKAGSFLPFISALSELGVYRHQLIWVKNSLVLGRGDYHFRHEPVLYGWKPGAPHHAVLDRSQDTVWEIDRPRRSAEHPTMKPVELITRALNNSADAGAVVLDPFAGSGSTLIAAHLTGRVARLIELDPRYVDVICRRYQEATGDKPVLQATGKPHDFTVEA